ncbi:STAS/SEC14 domain-containing protein [Tianweitania sediminis]|jgi:hypothetical protein|uniref:STAS/SEC14 domain-containing protein n=1 Tax=Tianweitania sediminis TaxID=1502156 RepID=A0A8J7RNN7_9HYPH|nr:STAS/SEC14 domain-containing protein [Tianweitania sediminis]MBP0439149.1 STAS/SEC14 domain-containing protein [Tianweitania sediminis]HEV7418184.1 STAS/SEC14 domain-containing protein [Tianweitania sediminis]
MPSSLDAVPAVRRIETDRDDVFACEITGHVSAADFENLYGLLEGAYALHNQVDVLVHFTNYDGVDWSEVSDNTKQEGQEHASRHVRRCASIGGPDWVSYFKGWFAPSVDVELRRFEDDEEEQAWAWIGARPIG